MNNKLKKIAAPGSRMYLLTMTAFAVAAYFLDRPMLAAAEACITLVLVVVALIRKARSDKALARYVESVVYDAENARSSTLSNFPLPMAVFRLDTTAVVWANDSFFQMCGVNGARLDASIREVVPGFHGRWISEGKDHFPEILSVGDRKYRVRGNLVRPKNQEENISLMGISYWLDVTDYEKLRTRYDNSRPVAAVLIIDNLDELTKNAPERVKNDIREGVEDIISPWAARSGSIVLRFSHDRFLLVFDQQGLDELRSGEFHWVDEFHRVVNPSGTHVTVTIGVGADAPTFQETLAFANMAAELALARGGDQAVVKNRLNFDFYGGRGDEVERRTKVKSRMIAGTFCDLVKDSSRVLVMGHQYPDLDCLGAAVGVCALAEKLGVEARIVMEPVENPATPLVQRLKADEAYKDIFYSHEDATLKADARTLLVVVDINRPEQVEDPDLLMSCNRVAVIDHHRVGSAHIEGATLAFVEPYASSTCELVTELLQEAEMPDGLRKIEADAMLSGIVLDTKSFSLRTGERTFAAASYLRAAGANTTEVKRLMQTDMEDTVAKYRIIQTAEQVRGVAIAVSETVNSRVTVAQAADELLNISGIQASVVISADGKGGSIASARSIGDMNVQILMEKLGGGGNRGAAAATFPNQAPAQARQQLLSAINAYFK